MSVELTVYIRRRFSVLVLRDLLKSRVNRMPISAHSSASCPRTCQAEWWDQPLRTHDLTISLSQDTNCDENEKDQVVFPSYNGVRSGKRVVGLEPRASPGADNSDKASSASNSISTSDPRPDSPPPLTHTEHSKDDTAVRDQPSQYVDYLSHDWEEEDIWSSWKHITPKRNVYGNSARLENALWRTWTRSKYRQKTVLPETLNW